MLIGGIYYLYLYLGIKRGNLVADKNFNKLLEEFDSILNSISTELSEKVISEFKKSNNQIRFCLDDGLDEIQKKINNVPSGSGLYLFEVNLQTFYKDEIGLYDDWGHNRKSINQNKRDHFFECINRLWNEAIERDGSSYPKIIKKRFFHHFCLRPLRNNFESEEWIPFYLGINKNIQGRVYQHVKCDSSTFSMKLSHLSETVFSEYPIRVSTFVIPNIESKRRYMLVKEIESIVRERLHPLVGKQ